MARAGRHHRPSSTRRPAPAPARHREVPPRRHPHRHRRRQPLTLGGPTPADSPLLRRPDLLRSLITLWQHHPSLSYLFSGRFIGPTSQAPRVDEGRARAPSTSWRSPSPRWTGSAPTSPPWLVDRLLRHLLVDVTGNTHRAEFCIDKLFSPDSRAGPARPARAARLRDAAAPADGAGAGAAGAGASSPASGTSPTPAPLVRWGTELHDRFLLPDCVAADIAEVVADLRRPRHRLRPGVARPLPRVPVPAHRRRSMSASVQLELRDAIEPWHVLGEEAASGGHGPLRRLVGRAPPGAASTAWSPGRHVVTCNGVPVPLHPTGTRGHLRRGRALPGLAAAVGAPPHHRRPRPAGLRPGRPLDSGARSAAARYHVVHPGGRAYEQFPVNANEAEARRASRFEATGHTPGPLDVAALRRAALGPARTTLARSTSGGIAGRRPPAAHRLRVDRPHRMTTTPPASCCCPPGPTAPPATTSCGRRTARSGGTWAGGGGLARPAGAGRAAASGDGSRTGCSTTTASPYNIYERAAPARRGRSTRCRLLLTSDEWSGDRAGRDPAGRAAQPRPRRPLRAARPAAPRPGAARAGPRRPELPPALRRHPPARARPARHRRRRPRPRRPTASPRSSPTAPRRRRGRLRPREPGGDVAGLPQPLPRQRRSTAWPRSSGRCAPRSPAPPRPSVDDPGSSSCSPGPVSARPPSSTPPGPLPRLPAGRGGRPHRPRRPGLAALAGPASSPST